MPARSNLFQKLVFLVKEQVAAGARVTESKMLWNRHTGATREVDICIESKIAGHDIVISVECTKRGRKADAPWVESMKTKHDGLPTDVLVLASDSGFSEGAERVASVYGIETLSLNKRDLAPEEKFFGDLEALFLTLFEIRPLKVTVRFGQTGEMSPEKVTVLPTNYLFTSDGNCVGVMKELVDNWLQSERFIKQIAERGDETHRGFVTGWVNPLNENRQPFCLQKDEPKVLRVIELIEITGACHFKIGRLALKYGLLGRIRVAWGTGQVEGEEALLVASQVENGRKRITLAMPGSKVGQSKDPER